MLGPTKFNQKGWDNEEEGGREREGGGIQVEQTATAWPISAEVRAWESDHQGVEALWPLYLAKKDTQQIHQ